ncbi:hypothetical protein [Nonomuraea jiangxiensis]|uniref:hypothetical protein n=1 Tax=Nonomuraea jiangxiensis TaxID=633440 RepID=UPI00115FE1E4|nr:hypothetical protein [Nonomuraea jiangxiensis]
MNTYRAADPNGDRAADANARQATDSSGRRVTDLKRGQAVDPNGGRVADLKGRRATDPNGGRAADANGGRVPDSSGRRVTGLQGRRAAGLKGRRGTDPNVWDGLLKLVRAGDTAGTLRVVTELDAGGRKVVAAALPGYVAEQGRVGRWWGWPEQCAPLLVAGVACLGGPAAVAEWLFRRELRWAPDDDPGCLLGLLRQRPAGWRADLARRVAVRVRLPELRHWMLAAELVRDAGIEPPDDAAFMAGWLRALSPATAAGDPLFAAYRGRIFEIDGLATADLWRTVESVVRLVADGLLERAAVIDGVVRRLLRDGASAPVPFAVLHDRLDLDLDEAACRAADYARLLPAGPVAVADLALTQLRRLEESGRLAEELFAEAVAALAFRPEKKLLRALVTWAGEAVLRDAGRVPAVLRAMASIFTQDMLALQEQAVRLALTVAPQADPDAREVVREAAGALPAELRGLIAAVYGDGAAAEAAHAASPHAASSHAASSHAASSHGASPHAGATPAGVLPVGMAPAGVLPVGAIAVGAAPTEAAPVGAIAAGAAPTEGVPVGAVVQSQSHTSALTPSPPDTTPRTVGGVPGVTPLAARGVPGVGPLVGGGVPGAGSLAGEDVLGEGALGGGSLVTGGVAGTAPSVGGGLAGTGTLAGGGVLGAASLVGGRVAGTGTLGAGGGVLGAASLIRGRGAGVVAVTGGGVVGLPGPVASPEELAREIADFDWPPDVYAYERLLAGLAEWSHRAPWALREALRAWWRPFNPEDYGHYGSEIDEGLVAVVRRAFLAFASPDNSKALSAESTTKRWRPRAPGALDRIYLQRARELVTAFEQGTGYPVLLATPTRGTGHVDPGVLLDRIELLEAGGVAALPADLAQALLRLPREVGAAYVRRAGRLTSEAGRTCAAWMRGGGLADPRVTVFVRAQHGRAGLWAELAPPPAELPAAIRGLFELQTGHTYTLGWWPLVLPSHRELVAAHLSCYLPASMTSADGQTAVLASVVHGDGPLGTGMAHALACGMGHENAADRAAATDALLTLAARREVPVAALAEAVTALVRADFLKLNRVVAVLDDATQAGAHEVVWEVVVRVLPGLLPAEGERPRAGAADLLAAGARAARIAGVRAEVPEVEAVAARKGSSRLVQEARRLRHLIAAPR